MKNVKLGTILENAARLAGRQVDTMGIPENWRALAALAMSEGIRKIAAEKLPMMQRVEFRRYRPSWNSPTGWKEGMECWHNGAYWRLKSASSEGEPGTDNKWTKIEMNDLTAFIAWDQPWEQTEIDRGAVDVNRFAFEADPKNNPTATPIKVVGMNEMGIALQNPAPEGVYVRFVPKYPNVSFVEWKNNQAYEAGDVVYMTTTKECYQAFEDVAAGSAAPNTSGSKWNEIRISDDFENFLTRYVAADLLTEDQGKYQTKASAETEFEKICERFQEGNGMNRIRTGRFVR